MHPNAHLAVKNDVVLVRDRVLFANFALQSVWYVCQFLLNLGQRSSFKLFLHILDGLTQSGGDIGVTGAQTGSRV